MLKEIGPAKSGFIAKSAMTFAQYITTAGLATRLFGEFPAAWKWGLVSAMLILVTFSISIFPSEGKEA